MRADIGATAVSSTSGLAPSQRFFAGGDRSVRGFGLNELSPVQQATNPDGSPKFDEDGNPVLEKVGGKHLVAGIGGADPRPALEEPGGRRVQRRRQCLRHLGRPAHVLGRHRRAPAAARGVGGHRRGAGADHSRWQHRAARTRACISTSRQNCDEAPAQVSPPSDSASFVLLVISFLAWVIYTEAGLRFVVARLPEKLGKVTLKIEDVRGTIAGGFSAALVDVDQELTHVRVENAARRASISGRCWSGASSVRDAHAELVLVEVKRAPAIRRRTRRRGSCRGFLSISAEHATTKSCWPSSRPMAGAWSSTTSAAPASSGTRPSASSKATSSTASCIRAPSANCAPPIRRSCSGETTDAHDHRRSARVARRRQLSTAISTNYRSPAICRRHSAPTCAASCSSWRRISTGRGKAEVHNFDLRAFGAGDALGIITGPLDLGGEMNAFHARGPLMVPGLGAGLFDARVRGQLRRPPGQRHALRGHAPRHRQPRRRRGHHRGGRQRPEAGARRQLARAALAAGGALHRGDAADLQQPRRHLSARGRLAVCAHREWRSVHSAARSDDGRDARRAAQGSSADRRARSRRLRRPAHCSPARRAGVPSRAGSSPAT